MFHKKRLNMKLNGAKLGHRQKVELKDNSFRSDWDSVRRVSVV